jgi:hypothetical protein
MSTQVEELDNVVSAAVAHQAKRTPESIRILISTMRAAMNYEVSDAEAEYLARDIEARLGVDMGLGAVVEDRHFKPWLNDAKPSIDPYYWGRYRKLLLKNKLPPDVVSVTDEVTDRILARLGNPNDPGPWDRRGMVVGHVQSGKTANYTGLICKAADAGYRLIVVIAGIHNNLRNQTQARIDEGFIGRDTGRLAMVGRRENPKQIGVGLFDGRRTPVSLTNTIKDFNKATATTNTSEIASYSVPVVLVIKKNPSTLKNLIEWLREHSARGDALMVDQPMLLIDDEADNASINIKYGKEEVSRINGQIRDLLNVFRRSCYVGYTATPFANIFIDPDRDDDVLKEDLFPRDFIIGLDAPTNYFGARTVFLDGMPEDGEPSHLRDILDSADFLPLKHKKDHELDQLPPSMIRALRSFVVARTIRNLRGQSGQHASMLVNASRFTDVQGKIKNRLRDALDRIRDAVRLNGALGDGGLRDPEIAALRAAWEAEYKDAWPDWSAIQAALPDAVAGALVVEVNSRNNDLDYGQGGERGLTVIAVGGFSLSRGLTLEGLTVSYFLRNSVMYDTLMQMGRWFGYRGGYDDLCRIWMPREAADWYAHIAEATEELHLELKRMEKAKATPQQFGLAVRSHPSSLIVTARNKIGSGEKHVLIGLTNSFVETTKLSAQYEVLEANRIAASDFLSSLKDAGFSQGDTERVPGGLLLRGVPVELIDDFLLAFRNARESVLSDPRQIRSYIANRAGSELARWDVLIASVQSKDGLPESDILGWTIGPASRAIGLVELGVQVLAISGKRSRVASRGVEKTGVDPERARGAEEAYLKANPAEPGKTPNYPDRIYREVRERPLLILHLLRVRASAGEEGKVQPEDLPDAPVVAWGISFPMSDRPEKKVEYVINTTKLREMLGEDDEDEDGADDDQ